MTAFQPKQRKNISEVDEEIAEMLEDIQERQLPAQAQARTEEQGVDLLSLASSPLREERSVQLQGCPYSLCVAHGRLYVCAIEEGLSEYSLQLQRRPCIIEDTKQLSTICSVAEAGGDALAVAGWKGLYIVNMKGEVLQRLSELEHCDVCLGSDGRLYTVGWSSSMSRDYRVQVYQQQRGGWIKTGQYDCPCTGGGCGFQITHMNDMIYMSCEHHNFLYKLKVDQPGEEWHNLGGAGELRCPRVSAADQQGSVLVTDMFNRRLVVLSAGGRCTELRTEPRLEYPHSAVIAGSTLYVACTHCFKNDSIRCFKLT